MATKKVEKIEQSNKSDLSKLSFIELKNLFDEAKVLIGKKQIEEQEKTKEEILKSKDVKSLKDNLKALEKEYNSFPSTLKVKLSVPVELEVNFDRIDFRSFIEELGQGYREASMEGMFGYPNLHVKVGSTGIDKIQKSIFEEAIRNYLSDNGVCEEVYNLFPQYRKAFRDFVNKTEKLNDHLDIMYDNDISFADIK